MSHYDLYSSLALDRSRTPEQLEQELTERLRAGNFSNAGGREEVELARVILGDPQKRSMYDARLGDTQAPDITPGALRDLASMNTAGNPGSGQQPVGKPASGNARGTSGIAKSLSLNGSNKNAVLVSALVGLVVGAILASLIATLIGGGSGIKHEGGARKLAKQFVNLRTPDETEKWVAENVSGEERKSIRSSLGLGDDFSGVDQYFGTGELKPRNFVDALEVAEVSFPMKDHDQTVREAMKEDEGIDSGAVVGLVDGNDHLRGNLMMMRENGEWKLTDVVRFDNDGGYDADDVKDYLKFH